jgi:hypothetical protein
LKENWPQVSAFFLLAEDGLPSYDRTMLRVIRFIPSSIVALLVSSIPEREAKILKYSYSYFFFYYLFFFVF